MRYVDSQGRQLRQFSFRCGFCKNEHIPNLVQVEGQPPFPWDIPINCPTCFHHIAMFNPSNLPEQAVAAELEAVQAKQAALSAVVSPATSPANDEAPWQDAKAPWNVSPGAAVLDVAPSETADTEPAEPQ